MDAMMTSLLLLLLVAIDDRPQLLCAALAIRFEQRWMIAAGLAVAAFVNCVIAAWLGSYVNRWISEDAVQMFFALSLIFAGFGMFAWRRPIDLLENWKIGPFATAALGLLILIFGDKGQFILGANAARTDAWIFAAIGGWIGLMIACLPAIILQEKLAAILPLALIRKIGGALILLLGLILALGALGLTG